MAAKKAKARARRPPRKVRCEICEEVFEAARGCPPCPSCGSEDTFALNDGSWPCSSPGCTVNKYGPEERINYGGTCKACRSGDGPVYRHKDPWSP